MNSKAKTQAKRERSAKNSRKTIFDGKLFQVTQEEIHYSPHKILQRDLIEHEPAVAVIALDEHNKILFVQQYRRAIDKILLEIPAGIMDKGEEPLDAAIRELDEETGYRAKTFTSLGGCYSTPGFCNEYIHFFLARDLYDGHLVPDEDEEIDLVRLTEEEVLEKMFTHDIYDAKTLAALACYFRERIQL